jgi:hypothetical protein
MSSLHVQATVPLFTSRGWDLGELGSAPGTTVKLYTATAYLGLSQRAVVTLINTGEIAATRVTTTHPATMRALVGHVSGDEARTAGCVPTATTSNRR